MSRKGPMMRRAVSIQDIAQAAGVSHATVSRALRDNPLISAEVRGTIQRLAGEMGYTPNAVAQSLKGQRSNTIGLVMTSIADPFYGRVARGVDEVAKQAGLDVFLGVSYNNAEQELAVIESFHRRRVDGILTASSRLTNGHIDLVETGSGTPAYQAAREGKLIPVVNLGLSRDPHFPQLKNTVDLGNPFSCTSDYGMIVPAGTPEPIRAKLEKALKEVLEDPGVKETLFNMGLNRQFQTGKEYREVVIKMVADNRRYHVALVDPLPAGLEIINPALAVSQNPPQEDPIARPYGWWWWGTWYEHQNLRDDRAEAFTSLLWDGVYEYTYYARATTPGTFIVPPTKAEEMYSPEVFGRSSSDQVIVE